MNPSEIIHKAETRYLNKVEFYNLVNRAVDMVVPKTKSESVNGILLEVATSAASVALVLKDLDER